MPCRIFFFSNLQLVVAYQSSKTNQSRYVKFNDTFLMIYQIEQTYSNVKDNRRRMMADIPINYNITLPSSEQATQAISKKTIQSIICKQNGVGVNCNFNQIQIKKLNSVSSRKSFIEVISNQMKSISTNVSRNATPSNKQNKQSAKQNKNKKSRESVPLRMKRPKPMPIASTINQQFPSYLGQNKNDLSSFRHINQISKHQKLYSERNGVLAVKNGMNQYGVINQMNFFQKTERIDDKNFQNNDLTRMQFENTNQQIGQQKY